jgi:excisionase family DNA binding protein
VIADLPSRDDVLDLGKRIDRLTALVESLASSMPEPKPWLSLKAAAERMGVDPRTVQAMAERGELITRRAGRRVLVDVSSLRPRDSAEISQLARSARR